MDEHEQGELVRSWLRQNGGAILGGIGVGLAAIFGWQWWQHSKAQHKVDAATLYQALEEAAGENNGELVERIANELGERYGDTLYGPMGLLQQADQKLGAGDLAAAETALKRAIELSRDPAIAGLAKLRLAQIELAAGKAQEALARLDSINKGDYAGLVAEIRGDALLVLGRNEDAISAYQDALTNLDAAAPNRGIVMMKLADLGAASTPEA